MSEVLTNPLPREERIANRGIDGGTVGHVLKGLIHGFVDLQKKFKGILAALQVKFRRESLERFAGLGVMTWRKRFPVVSRGNLCVELLPTPRV